MTARMKTLVAEFGKIALAVYLVIFFGTWSAFALAIAFGVEVEGAAGSAGTIGAAWVATKLTQPLRIAATIALTPVVAGLRGARREPAEEAIPAAGAVPVEQPADPSLSG